MKQLTDSTRAELPFSFFDDPRPMLSDPLVMRDVIGTFLGELAQNRAEYLAETRTAFDARAESRAIIQRYANLFGGKVADNYNPQDWFSAERLGQTLLNQGYGTSKSDAIEAMLACQAVLFTQDSLKFENDEVEGDAARASVQLRSAEIRSLLLHLPLSRM